MVSFNATKYRTVEMLEKKRMKTTMCWEGLLRSYDSHIVIDNLTHLQMCEVLDSLESFIFDMVYLIGP